MLEGLILRGKLIGEKEVEFKRKNGEIGKSRTITVLPKGRIETIAIEVPLDYKIEKDKDGNIEIPARAVAYCVTCEKFLRTNLKLETT